MGFHKTGSTPVCGPFAKPQISSRSTGFYPKLYETGVDMASTEIVCFQREPHICELELDGAPVLDPFELLRVEHWR